MNKHVWVVLTIFIVSCISTAQEKKEKFLDELKQEFKMKKFQVMA